MGSQLDGVLDGTDGGRMARSIGGFNIRRHRHLFVPRSAAYTYESFCGGGMGEGTAASRRVWKCSGRLTIVAALGGVVDRRGTVLLGMGRRRLVLRVHGGRTRLSTTAIAVATGQGWVGPCAGRCSRDGWGSEFAGWKNRGRWSLGRVEVLRRQPVSTRLEMW